MTICKKCTKNKKGFCNTSGEPIKQNRRQCVRFKEIKTFQQTVLFDAVGNEVEERTR